MPNEAVTPPADLRIHAGFWRRSVAMFVDALLVGLAAFLASFVTVSAGLDGLVSTLLPIVIGWLYYAFSESSAAQATVGKRILGVKVVGRDGARISFLRATGRWAGRYLSALLFGLGYLLAGWTKHARALHDMLAGTLVVSRHATEEAARDDRATRMPASFAVIFLGVVVGSVLPIGILAAVAIPAYSDFTHRSRITEAQAAAAACRIDADEFVRKNNAWPAASDLRCVMSGRHVRDVQVVPGAVIATIQGVHALVDGQSIRFEALADGIPIRDATVTRIDEWRCATTIPKDAYKYVPVTCRFPATRR